MIADWALERGIDVTSTHLYRGESLPEVASFDWLVIMGGPMNIYEYRTYPWLREEKQLIAQAIESGKTVIGICLGAQLIADVLGAKIYQNQEMEIGWFPVRFLESRKAARGFEAFPPELTVLHWHGDTFDLPQGATRIAESDACRNQGFIYGDKVVGLQFHIEVAEKDVAEFIGETLPPKAAYIQAREEILAETAKSQPINTVLKTMLDRLAE